MMVQIHGEHEYPVRSEKTVYTFSLLYDCHRAASDENMLTDDAAVYVLVIYLKVF